MEKHDFFIITDDGSSVNGFIIRAYSREQIERIFGLPKCNWVTIFESDYEDNEIFLSRVKDNLGALTFDVDNPTGMLEYYMQQNEVIFTGVVDAKTITELADKFDEK